MNAGRSSEGSNERRPLRYRTAAHRCRQRLIANEIDHFENSSEAVANQAKPRKVRISVISLVSQNDRKSLHRPTGARLRGRFRDESFDAPMPT
jgi:hypothetical protein